MKEKEGTYLIRGREWEFNPTRERQKRGNSVERAESRTMTSQGVIVRGDGISVGGGKGASQGGKGGGRKRR